LLTGHEGEAADGWRLSIPPLKKGGIKGDLKLILTLPCMENSAMVFLRVQPCRVLGRTYQFWAVLATFVYNLALLEC